MSVPNDFDVDDKVCVITGGSGVLGSEMARALGENGATVVVLARGEEKLRETGSELAAAGIEHLTVSASVLDRAELEAAAETVIDEYGRIDVLINAAGGNAKQDRSRVDRIGDHFHGDDARGDLADVADGDGHIS